MTTNTSYQHEFEALSHSGNPLIKIPYLDVTSEDVTAYLEIPGVSAEDIKAKFTKYGLEVSAHTWVLIQRKSGTRKVTTRKAKTYHRLLAIPYILDQAKAKASFKDGVLSVRIPRLEIEGTTNRKLLAIGEL